MSHYIVQNGRVNVAGDSALEIHDYLPVGTYVIKFNEMPPQFYLERVDSFTLPKKLYGKTDQQADRILTTFGDRPFGTGVLLAGEKGSGKTLLAKLLSIKAAQRDIPTLILNHPYAGDLFNQFIQAINQPCVIFFDEFEKVYHEREIQHQVLTLLDGVFPTKKLFVLTCNNKYSLDEHFHNRPGRLYYQFDYSGLEPEFIREYCKDQLKDKAQTETLVKVAALFGKFNFDMLQAMVEEMNRFGESPQEVLKYVNCKPSDEVKYEHSVIVDGKAVGPDNFNINVRHNQSPISIHRFQVSVDLDPDGDIPEFANCGSWIQVDVDQSKLSSFDTDKGSYTYVTEATDDNKKKHHISVTFARREEKLPAYYHMLA
jgi:hypothetical protein